MLHAATIAVVGRGARWTGSGTRCPSYPTVSEVWLRLLETAGL